MVPEKDSLLRFVFEQTNVRGEWVHLDDACFAVFENQSYPLPVRCLLGELLAAASLLAATIKYSGFLHLQIQGDGPVSLLLVQVAADKSVRGLAKWQDGMVEAVDYATLLGAAKLVITIDSGEGKERYQGIVEIEGNSISASLDAYFRQSEQLTTRLWLTCDGKSAAGLLLQQLPGETCDNDAWRRETFLTETVTNQELLDLPATQLLYRLFNEEDVRLFKAQTVIFFCPCSRDRIRAVLQGLGAAEVKSIMEEQETIDVQCEFCGRQYSFDAVDSQLLFFENTVVDLSKTRH
ncbi:MAG: Hsp33 family molecular chaperone HslO [Gammaproteobacteria bacterium]